MQDPVRTASTEEEREILRNTPQLPFEPPAKTLTLTCFKCKTVFTFTGEDKVHAAAKAYVKARGICKTCS